MKIARPRVVAFVHHATSMGDHDLGPAAGAVELPPLRVVPLAARRRHRSFTGTAGILLFVCLFLPAVKGCDADVVPYQMPWFCAPYVYGLAFAVIALARTPRAVAAAVVALRVLACVVIAGATVVTILNVAIGCVLLVVGGMLLATIGWDGGSERRLAATAILIGAVSSAWFALWCASPDALLGVKLSFASSLALVVGGMIWAAELVLAGDRRMPEAVWHRRS